MWYGRTKPIVPGIFKTPTVQKCKVKFLGIEGDGQADLKYHGGRDKAVYAYDLSYYDMWKNLLPEWKDRMTNYGLFGENLTTSALPDEEVYIGDIFKIGTSVLQAIQPRFPCSKLNVRFQRSDVVNLFFQHQKNGIYFRVLEEGYIQKGDSIELIEASPYKVSIADITVCYNTKGKGSSSLASILNIPLLPEDLKNAFKQFGK